MKLIKPAGCEIPNLTCRECAGRYEANSVTQVFCSAVCRSAHDTRRIERGKILYDIFMELRYNRRGASGLWSLMCRVGELWRDEDKRLRAGRQSWKDPAYVTDKNPHLLGKRGRI